MPSKLYDNAFLDAKKPGKDYTVDILKNASEGKIPRKKVDSADPGVGGDPLAEARAFLDKPGVLESTNVRDRAEVDARLAWQTKQRELANKDRAKSMMQEGSFGDENPLPDANILPSLRGLSKGMHSAGEKMQTASLLSLLPGPMRKLGMPLIAAGELMQAPENIVSGIEDPANAMGWKEGAARIGGLLLGSGLGKRAAAFEPEVEMAGGKVARQMGPLRGNGPDAYQFETAPSGVNESFQRAGLPDTRLPASWQKLVQGEAAPAPKQSLMDAWYARNPSQEGRTVGHFTEGSGGMHDLAQGRIQPSPMPTVAPTRPLQGAADDILDGVGPEIDLSPFVSAQERMAQLSKQRAYGQAFRANKPLVEGF